MNNILTIQDLDCTGKRIIVRADLDIKVNQNGEVKDDSRLAELIPTLNLLLEKGAAKIVLLGHRGRPEGVFDQQFSLKAVGEYLKTRFSPDIAFLEHKPREIFHETYDEYALAHHRVVLLENLRFYKDEEDNSASFAEELSFFGEIYVNESFASSHRNHTSVIALPKHFEAKSPNSTRAGLHLAKEVAELSKLRDNPAHPIVFVVSGLKEDKLVFLPNFKEMADRVLIAGRLPEYMPEEQGDPKVLVARLNPDKEDITVHSIELFEQILFSAKTIFVSGPLGKFEEPGHRLGTERVFETIAKSNAYKVAGGGDTTSAIHALKLENSFDWISSGGGASLEFVAKGTLPGLEALTG